MYATVAEDRTAFPFISPQQHPHTLSRVPDMLDWSAALPEVSYPAGAVLIGEGEVHGKLFVLLDGALEISRAGTFITVVDAPGAIFGEMSALLGSAATATVRAVRDSRLRRTDDPQGFLDGHPLMARAVATTLARRLDTINGYLLCSFSVDFANTFELYPRHNTSSRVCGLPSIASLKRASTSKAR